MFLPRTQSVLCCTMVLVFTFILNSMTMSQIPTRADIHSQFYAIDEFGPADYGTNVIIYRDARYIGGMKALRQYMKENVVYQDVSGDSDFSGKILIRCTIGKDGTVKNATVERSVNPAIDSAVINAALSMPLWEPAIQYGLPIETKLIIPFKIK
jgi:periplasmic protein TonB